MDITPGIPKIAPAAILSLLIGKDIPVKVAVRLTAQIESIPIIAEIINFWLYNKCWGSQRIERNIFKKKQKNIEHIQRIL